MEPPPFTNSACLAKFAGLNSGFGWWSLPYNDLTSYYMLAIEGNHPPSRQDVFLLFLMMCVYFPNIFTLSRIANYCFAIS